MKRRDTFPGGNNHAGTVRLLLQHTSIPKIPSRFGRKFMKNRPGRDGRSQSQGE